MSEGLSHVPMENSQDRARGPASPAEREQGEGESAPLSPTPYAEADTPSGIHIAYHFEPRRYYEISGERKLAFQHLQYPPQEVPSVSTVVDVIDRSGPLTWWGMTVGIDGVLQLVRGGDLEIAKTAEDQMALAFRGAENGLYVASVERVVDMLKMARMTTNDVKGAAGDRGQSAHDALEEWAQNGAIPDPSFYSEEEAGYIVGLRMFLLALEEAEPEVIASERMVASLEHGFAGRYDLEIRTNKTLRVPKRWTPKRGPKWVEIPPSLIVPDLKTSKSVYETHFVQLEGYELGRLHSGYEPSDARAVIHVHPGDPKDDKQPDGPYYEFVRSTASAASFLKALDLYREMDSLKGWKTS